MKFKGKMCGIVTNEFAGLKTKMYSILYEDKRKMSANGVCRFAQTSLTHQVYKNVFNEGGAMRSDIVRIGAVKHDLKKIQTNKILTAFDDKRFIVEDRISCLPFGHFEVRDIPVLRAVAEEHDWGEFSEPEEETLTNNSNISSSSCSRIISVFYVSPPARVPSLTHSGVAKDSIGLDEPITLSLYSDDFFFTPRLWI